MEECTLRTCVDRFNNRRYLSGQMCNSHRNAVPNNPTVQASIGTTNLSNQMAYASNNIGSGVGMNGNSGGNGSNGMSNCVAQANTNGQQPAIVFNDANEQYDNSGLVDVAVNSLLVNGGQDRGAYTPGYGSWDDEQIELSDEFKQHYEVWLQREVYNIKIDWDSLRTVYDIQTDVNEKANKIPEIKSEIETK